MIKKGSILLVEDNPMDIELTLNAFEEIPLDYEIYVLKSGEEALDYLFGRKEFSDRQKYPLPDVVLLDIKLPGISGIDALKTIKTTPIFKRLPVIIFTSSQEKKDLIMGYDFGANSYLDKPVSFENFLTSIRTFAEYWLTQNIKPPLDTNKLE